MKITKFMSGFRIILYFILALLIVNFADAATVYGTVYDLSLKKVNNARVEVNTVPKQFMVTQNGTYSFNIPNGRYSLKASLLQKGSLIASVEENITISQDGSYVLDLIMFPDIAEGIEEPGIDFNGNVIQDSAIGVSWIAGLVVLAAVAAAIVIVYFYRKKKNASGEKHAGLAAETQDDDLDQVIKIIKQEGGRATQKEIRKQIPLSEAKISLMIAELEHKGAIEKIKKGRGNIIILKKK